jgi:tetratricopeptide (TPR) repeat protein
VAPTSTPEAAPSEGDARQQLEQAMQLYESGRYAEALEVFERVYAFEPNPAVLFNIGAVHAALHHCELARDAYRRYIEQTRSESGRADAQQQLERLNECHAAPSAVDAAQAALPSSELAPAAPHEGAVATSATAAAPEAPPPAPVTAPSTDLPPPMATDSPPNAMRVAGWVAIGTGGVLGLASLGCAYASWRADTADSGASPGQSGDAAAREQDAGQRYNSLAWGLAGGAAALAGSGLLLLWLQPDEQTSVQVAAPGGGLGLSLEQRF